MNLKHFFVNLFSKKTLCKLGSHKSDRDYGIRWSDKAVISSCERCDKEIVHKNLRWLGGGNY
jgi:hypothetical protein